MLTNPRWADAARTTVLAEREGRTVAIPADRANTDYRSLVDGDAEAGLAASPIGAPAIPVPSADDVRAEAGRRIRAVFPVWRQMNMHARDLELSRKGEANWNAQEVGEAARLQRAFVWITQVRAASNALEADPPPDFRDGVHWPADPIEAKPAD